MAQIEALQRAFQPIAIEWELPGDEALVTAAGEELRGKAGSDANGCYGYFPGMRGLADIDSDLPHSQAFAEAVPTITIGDKALGFNFVRTSLVQQRGDAPFHLDSDAATALTGDVGTLGSRLVWRLLLNLSGVHPRTLAYLDANIDTVRLSNEGGYIHCEDKAAAATARTHTIAPRAGRLVSGVLFCANRVLHTGRDDENGHFVAGYGCEQPVPPINTFADQSS